MILISEKSNGQACSSSIECLVTDSVCSGGLCGCPANTYLEGMSCLNSKLMSSVTVRGLVITRAQFQFMSRLLDLHL